VPPGLRDELGRVRVARAAVNHRRVIGRDSSGVARFASSALQVEPTRGDANRQTDPDE
jgi:hypothetical protein